jgi:hypothetical protein
VCDQLNEHQLGKKPGLVQENMVCEKTSYEPASDLMVKLLQHVSLACVFQNNLCVISLYIHHLNDGSRETGMIFVAYHM